MNWTIDWGKQRKRLKTFHSEMSRRIEEQLDKAAKSGDPRKDAKPLKGAYAGQSVYKISGYRAIVEFDDAKKVIKVTKVGPRGTVYRRTRIYRVSEDPADWQPTDDGADDGQQ